MDGSKSREALVAFLTSLADQGLVRNDTVQARKAAVSKILGLLKCSEAKDVTVIDLDQVAERFGRLHGKDYAPASLAAYKSRLKSAVEDFKFYLANPLDFYLSVPPRDDGRRMQLPRFEHVTVLFRKGDLRGLNEECLAARMTRSQWISALVRNRLNRKAQFAPADRVRLATLYRIILAIEEHIAKIARPLSRPGTPLADLSIGLDELKDLRADLTSILNEIRDVLRVNEIYWGEGSK